MKWHKSRWKALFLLLSKQKHVFIVKHILETDRDGYKIDL